MSPPFRLVLTLAILSAGHLTAIAGLLDFLGLKRDIEVITNTVVTAEGKSRPAASKSAPQYYIAVNLGFQDFGGAIAGITEPPNQSVIPLITTALAKQGYLPATEGSPPPTLLLTFAWGTLNTEMNLSGNPDLDGHVINRRQILSFLGGEKLGLDDRSFDSLTAPIAGLTTVDADARDLYEATVEDFYVTTVAAYDLGSVQARKRQMLWITRIATFSRGFDLPDTLPTMLAIGGAHFGRETDRPVWQRASERFKTEVNIGELEFVEYVDGAKAPVVDAAPEAVKPDAKPRKR